jgi:hypothetical protein
MLFVGACGMTFGSSTSASDAVSSDNGGHEFGSWRDFLALWGGVYVAAISLAVCPSPGIR